MVLLSPKERKAVNSVGGYDWLIEYKEELDEFLQAQAKITAKEKDKKWAAWVGRYESNRVEHHLDTGKMVVGGNAGTIIIIPSVDFKRRLQKLKKESPC